MISDFQVGCFLQIIIAIVSTFISKFLIGYSLGVWFGAQALANWESTNILLQLVVSFVAASISIPVGVVSFIVSLVANTPVL